VFPASWYYLTLGQAQYAAGEYEAAVETLRRDETYRTSSTSQTAIRSESCPSPDRVMLLADMKALQRITDNSLRQCP
jgi:hypothetical protein